MRRSVLMLAVLAAAGSGRPALAQPADGAELPCWGFCRLWMGQDAEPGAEPPHRTGYRMRRQRWSGFRAVRHHRDRDVVSVERDAEEPAERPRRSWRRMRRVAPLLAIARPAAPPPVRPSRAPTVTPAVAGPPSVQPKLTPVAAPASPVPKAPGPDVPAAPLE